jgi:tripartite ATP-independent transporter DctP family solute receptor
VEAFAKMVQERTNGNVVIKIAGSEQLGSDVSMLTSLRTGALDLTVNSQGAASGLVPELAVFGLPYLFSSAEAGHKVLEGPIGEELAKKFAAVGVVPLDWWDNGMRHTTNSKRPVTTPADLKGLKIRTPADPATVDIFQALGAATQQVPFGELYIALQQGVVDGQENPLANIHSAKLHEVNKYISLTGHQWQSTPFLMSQLATRKVKPAELDIIKAAAKEAGTLQRKLMAEADAKLLGEYKASPNVTVNEPDLAPFKAATAAVIDKWKAKPFGEFVRKVVEAAQGK